MDDRELIRYFADLAGRLMVQGSVQETMGSIVAAAVEVVEGCDHASISHMRGQSLISESSNDEVGGILDGIQTGAGEGPCLDAIRTGEILVSRDLGADERWPTYGPRAVEATGVRSSVGLPIRDGRRVVGALNLFADRVGAFDEDTVGDAAAAILVAHSSPALVAALHKEDMEAALRSRDMIGQAKGVLMARSGLDEDAAFALLVNASQRMQLKLAEVARRLVAGDLTAEDG